MFEAGTGVRISEALGLTVDRIDFLRRTVRIDRQIVDVVDDRPVFGPLKDRKNRPRVIPLPTVVLDALSLHLASRPAGPPGLVFTNEQDGPIRRTTFSDIWRKAVGPLGVPAGEGFHELRHFYASLLISHAESVRVVQERLGHTSALMTLDIYAQLWPESDDSTREAVDAALGRAALSDLCQAEI
jgi:integrase